MRQQGHLTEGAVGSLLKARILSLLKYHGPFSVAALASDLGERIRLIQGVPRSASIHKDGLAFMNKCLDDLIVDDLIECPAGRTIDSVVSSEKKLTGKERREYEALKAKEKKRRHKALSKKRAAASRHGKKKHR